MRPYTLHSLLNQISGLLIASIAIGVMVSTPIANAGIVTINFPDDVVASNTPYVGFQDLNNATADGFRISPTGEYDLIQASFDRLPGAGIGWNSEPSPITMLGWTTTLNPNYLGPIRVSSTSLYIDHSGDPFTLMSVNFLLGGGDDFEMVSSKGGVFDVPSNIEGTLDLSISPGDPQWTDIQWLVFGFFDSGEPTVGISQLVASVDEPVTLPLFAVGLIVPVLLYQRRVVNVTNRGRELAEPCAPGLGQGIRCQTEG
jgi:hypothetical protein